MVPRDRAARMQNVSVLKIITKNTDIGTDFYMLGYCLHIFRMQNVSPKSTTEAVRGLDVKIVCNQSILNATIFLPRAYQIIIEANEFVLLNSEILKSK